MPTQRIKDMKEERYHKLYMNLARQVANMSYAIKAQVGCIAVKEGRVISMGWNGTPTGFDNNCEDFDIEQEKLVTKPEVLHAELNCISKIAASTESSKDSSIYVTLSPCLHCAKIIAQAGVKEVYYDREYDDSSGIELLRKLNIKCEKLI